MIVNNQAYFDFLHGEVRDIQRFMKKHEAPLRHYDGKPRHVRETPRSYDGKNLRELVVLNVGMGDCAWSNCRMCGLSTRAESLNEESVLVGHSSGCAFLVRWIGETKVKVKKVWDLKKLNKI